MKILVFGLSSQRGGVESVILNFCTEILEQGLCEFDFVVIDEVPKFAQYLERYGCRFYVVPNRLKSYFGYNHGLKKVFLDNTYDYVWYNVCTLSDMTLLKIARKAGVRTILHAHNSENMGNTFNGFLHDQHKKNIDACVDRYVSCSAEAARFTFPKSIINRPKSWTLLKNAISVRQFCYSKEARDIVRRRYFLEGNCVIGHVGRLHLQKNHKKILSVFDNYYRYNPRARLVLIGDGLLESQIREEVQRRKLADAVLMPGSVDNVADWLSAFDLFLFPSLYEGLGIALLEAQASGLPCVISDTIPVEAICTDRVRCVSLSADDVVWAQEMEGLLSTYNVSERENTLASLAQAGYDISVEAPKFVGLLRRGLQDK